VLTDDYNAMKKSSIPTLMSAAVILSLRPLKNALCRYSGPRIVVRGRPDPEARNFFLILDSRRRGHDNTDAGTEFFKGLSLGFFFTGHPAPASNTALVLNNGHVHSPPLFSLNIDEYN